MSEANKELQNLVDDLRAKLGDNVIDVRLVDFDENNEPPAESREPQREPGEAIPDEVLATMSQMAETVARAIFGDAIESMSSTVISPVDDSPEAARAMREMLRSRFGMQGAQCYHYILNEQGQPVHCEDGEALERFQRRNGHIVANKRFDCLGLKMQVTTGFMVHNAWDGGEPPRPQWATQLIREDDEDVGFQQITHSAADAMRVHRFVCAQTQRGIAVVYRERRPSPLRRAKAAKRIAAGQDVLRRKPTKESNDHWMRRMIKEAFGDMEGPEVAHILGLPELRRKRGVQ